MFDQIPLQLTLGQTGAVPEDGPGPAGPANPATPGGEGLPADGGNGNVLEDSTPTNTQREEVSPFGGILPILILIMVAFLVMSIFSQRKEKKRRQALLADLKKNDKVVTIGGIVGTIVELRDNEVVLKVDESSNTRMRFTRSAIQGPLASTEETKD
jgi:preprotein translocase subunit YajC